MKVVTFGEIMIRFAPKGYTRFFQTNEFEATFGGGEANVAVSLSNYGVDVTFVTKLPKNDIGEAIIRDLRGYGVDTTKIARGGKRVGIYYLEKGASQRASQVIYDRHDSSIATATPDDFDWDCIFKDATWFHFTGITPALSDNATEIALKAVQEAHKRKIIVSCDLNYRKKLWSQQQAQTTMTKLAPYIDVLIANEEDAEKTFGIKAPQSDIKQGSLNREGYQHVAHQLKTQYHFKQVAITLRESISASDNNWSAMLYDGEAYHTSKIYPIHIVDRVGGGDAFAAGLIYASLNHFSSKKAIEFAVAASCLKHTIEGDYNRVSVDEVMKLVEGDGSGRVQR